VADPDFADDAEDQNEDMEDGPPDPLDDDFDDEGMFGDGDEPVTADWLRERLGASGVRDPRESQARTKLRDRIDRTPIMAAAETEGAVQWLIERRNDKTGEADWVGYAHLEISLPMFIDQFYESMPDKGDQAAEFYFTPIDKRGGKLGAPGKPQTFTVPWNNVILLEVRKARGDQPGNLSGTDGVVKLLLDERRALGERLSKSEQRAHEVQEAWVKAQIESAKATNNEMAGAYARVSEIQEKGFVSVLSAQDRMALDREKREETGRQRDRDERTAALERLKEEAKADRERIKAENDAALERMRAETAARQAEIEAKVRLDEKRIEAEIEKAKAAAQAERERARDDREREEARRASEDQRRAEEREREETRRMQDQARRETLEANESARREAAAERARELDREYALSLEKMRQESLAAAKDSLERESVRARDHQTLIVSTLKERYGDQGGSGLGIVGKMLDTFGLTPADAIEKARELMGNESSIGAELIKGITELGKEVVKRLPAPEDFEDEEDDDDYDTEDEEAAEAVRERDQRRRRIEARRQRQIAKDQGAATAAVARAPTAAAAEPEVSGPDLDAFLAKRTPDPEPDEEGEDAPATPDLPAAPVLPLAEAKAGRDAVASMVERLEAEKPEHWGNAVLAAEDTDDLLRYIGLVGLIRALDGYDIDVAAVGETLVALGLFDAPPMMPSGV